MHIDLHTPFGDVYWKSLASGSYPSMRLINACKYLQCGYPQNSVIEYRTCKNASIGYMNIPTFSGGTDGLSLRDERYLIIDEILSKWKNMKGIIIDLRGNHGGNSNNAECIAGRFVDKSRVYAQYREKTGPGKQDFSPWKSSTINPEGDSQFLKPVVVLTSRATASSAEVFVMAMQVLPNVTIVGDTTGGGVGSPIYRELPNGWTYRLSTRYYADFQQRIMEGVGIFPDIPILTTSADSSNGIDRILEKGIEIITNSK
jgi:C-terminal processing protease CtpA/Prc